MIRPLRNLVLVERVVREKTPGGIHVPQTFDHKRRPSLKHGAVREHFEAKVLAVGPDVRDLTIDDHILVFTFGGGERLYTGDDGGDGRMFVRFPDDVVCALDPAEVAT